MPLVIFRWSRIRCLHCSGDSAS